MSLLKGPELVRQLQQGGKRVADGAVGSELIRAGALPARTAEANLTHSEWVRALHRRAMAAGADLITTNTFGTPFDDRTWAEAFQAGIDIAHTEAYAANREIAVMVSVYPAELLRNPAVVLKSFREAACSVSLLLVETAVDIAEAVEAVERARRNGIVTIAATCHFQPNGAMPDGTSPERAAFALKRAGASIVGANCGAVPEDLLPVAERMRSATDLPLLFQPNAGLPEREGERWIYPVDPARFAANAARLYAAGVSIVGGCCGTTPAHIAAVRSLLFHPQCRE